MAAILKIISEIELCQWLCIYLKNTALKLHPNRIWKDEALKFFQSASPQQEVQEGE